MNRPNQCNILRNVLRTNTIEIFFRQMKLELSVTVQTTERKLSKQRTNLRTTSQELSWLDLLSTSNSIPCNGGKVFSRSSDPKMIDIVQSGLKLKENSFAGIQKTNYNRNYYKIIIHKEALSLEWLRSFRVALHTLSRGFYWDCREMLYEYHPRCKLINWLNW